MNILIKLVLSLFLFGAMVGMSVSGDTNKDFTTEQPTVYDIPIQTEFTITGFIKPDNENNIVGFALYAREPCEIQITLPTNPNDAKAFCSIGHEVWHCLTGDFHKGFAAFCYDSKHRDN